MPVFGSCRKILWQIMPERLPNRTGRARVQKKWYQNAIQNEQKSRNNCTKMGQTESIIIKKIVKQRSIFGPTICCETTSEVNSIGEAV